MPGLDVLLAEDDEFDLDLQVTPVGYPGIQPLRATGSCDCPPPEPTYGAGGTCGGSCQETCGATCDQTCGEECLAD